MKDFFLWLFAIFIRFPILMILTFFVLISKFVYNKLCKLENFLQHILPSPSKTNFLSKILLDLDRKHREKNRKKTIERIMNINV